MLQALVDGTQTPVEMAHLAKGALRKKLQALIEALEGRLTEDHRFVLTLQLERLAQVEQSIALLDARIDEKLRPYAEEHRRLMQIPGVDRVGAASMIAELGVDMSVFPTAPQAAAWAGVCPGNNESAGRHKNRPHRKGNVHLTTTLVQAAMCGSKKKGRYLKAKYWHLRARRGPQRAAVAIAHRILVAAYHMLSRQADYRDLGADYLDRKVATKRKAHLVRGLEALGYRVTLEQKAA